MGEERSGGGSWDGGATVPRVPRRPESPEDPGPGITGDGDAAAETTAHDGTVVLAKGEGPEGGVVGRPAAPDGAPPAGAVTEAVTATGGTAVMGTVPAAVTEVHPVPVGTVPQPDGGPGAGRTPEPGTVPVTSEPTAEAPALERTVVAAAGAAPVPEHGAGPVTGEDLAWASVPSPAEARPPQQPVTPVPGQAAVPPGTPYQAYAAPPVWGDGLAGPGGAAPVPGQLAPGGQLPSPGGQPPIPGTPPVWGAPGYGPPPHQGWGQPQPGWQPPPQGWAPPPPRRGRGPLAAAVLVLVLLVVAGAVVGDWYLRVSEMEGLLDGTRASETAMSDTLDDIDAAIEDYSAATSTSDQEDALTEIEDAAASGRSAVAAAGDDLDALGFLPWHPALADARDRYVEHNRAWQDYLDAVSDDPMALNEEQPEISSTWQQAHSAYEAAVPAFSDGLRADVDEIFASDADADQGDGDVPDGGTDDGGSGGTGSVSDQGGPEQAVRFSGDAGR